MCRTAKAPPGATCGAIGVPRVGAGSASHCSWICSAELVLPLVVEQVGDEQLVDDEQQHDEAGGDQQLADAAGRDLPERVATGAARLPARSAGLRQPGGTRSQRWVSSSARPCPGSVMHSPGVPDAGRPGRAGRRR